MKRLALFALLIAAPLAAQRDTTPARGGRGAGRGGGGGWNGAMDSSRIRQLYVSKDPADLRGCGTNCERDMAGKRRTDSVYTAKAPGNYEFQKIKYKSRADGLEIPAYVFSPIKKSATKHAALVWVHGGVHGDWNTGLYPFVVEAVKRGYVILAPDYRGSTGYGRAYRERLYGEWGIVDVEDCVRAVEHVAAEGRADGNRALITGSSAGGYTVLCALVGYDRFRAGASHYGIGDLALLVSDTHKFESRYTQRLIGDDPEIWRERSPIHHVGRIDCPVLFLQGLEDRVVPPEQSQHMVAALRARGVPVAYLEFAGESHGFRRAETLRRALEAELDFHTRVLRLAPAEPLVPVVIEPPLP